MGYQNVDLLAFTARLWGWTLVISMLWSLCSEKSRRN